MTKILFLDIDGVLNSHRSFIGNHIANARSAAKTLGGSSRGPAVVVRRIKRHIDPIAVGMVSLALHRSPEVRIVLSSTHRMSFKRMRNPIVAASRVLQALGFPKDCCVGLTPVLLDRSYEIAAWLEVEGKILGVTDYAILDDMPPDSFTEEQRRFLVTCDPQIGISADNYRELTGLLGNPDNAIVCI